MTEHGATYPDLHGPRIELAPATERGWFGGRSLSAGGGRVVAGHATLAQAGEALQAAFDGKGPALVAVLARYDGSCSIVEFGQVAIVTGEDDRAAVGRGAAPDPRALLSDATWDLSPREYRAAVQRARELIAAGDVYVINLTARLSGTLAGRLAPEAPDAPVRVFATLLQRAAGDMSALAQGFDDEEGWLASVSPERFLRVTAGEHGSRVVEVCPIKGTAPRGLTPDSDASLAASLAANPKERAEHVMVVDLERNDIGVCCVPGTVHVEPLYEVVPTPYCHQLVSSVRGTLRAEATFAQLLEAAFPCGSVTGAPKIAAMRIIAELEASPRGPYCGSLIVAMPGELDSSVLIRTLEVTGTSATWGAGCGITYESDPAAEYLELLLKASPATGDMPPSVALRETMRVAFGRVPLLDHHLARLARGGCGPSVLGKVRAAALDLAATFAEKPYGRLGVTVTPDGEVAVGITADRSSLDVEAGPIVVPIAIEELPAPVPGAAKPASRHYWDKAHATARMRGGHQAILHDADGTIIDGSTANVWLLHGDVLSTPPAPPAVGGVMREVVFDAAPRHGLCAVERRLALSDLESADEVYLSNAIGGMVRARLHRVIG